MSNGKGASGASPVAAIAASQKHLPALDGVRSLAILMVMVFHFFQHGAAPVNAILRSLSKMAALGQAGVDLFFVLSGFLITGILLDARGKDKALRIFYLRRTFRIFPLYYGYLAVAFVLLPVLHLAHSIPWHDQWWFWVYGQNIQDTFIRNFKMFGPGHFWSLAVEEHFYLFWPFLVMRLSIDRLKRVLCGIVLLAILVRALLTVSGYPVYYFTLCRIDTLALGALLAVYAREEDRLPLLARWLRRRVLWFLLAVIPLYAIFSGVQNPVVQVFKFSLFAVLCATLLTIVLTTPPRTLTGRLFGNPIASAVAKGSYAMYVFHPAIFDLLRDKLPGWPVSLAMPLAFGATFAASWLSWHLWENPFLKLRDRIQQSMRPKPVLVRPAESPATLTIN